jgi:NAD(P)-dependent dehydrogenase (short-subunit alcohol dehydrogenase family)
MLSGKTIIVAGATRGFGRHIAHRLHAEGAELLALGRDEAKLNSLRNDLGERVMTLPVNLATQAGVDATYSFARERWPRLDVLINNFAIQGPIGCFWKSDADEWSKTIATNLLAPVNLCRVFAPWMIEAGAGKIVNVSGGGATAPRQNFTAYGTSKAGLVRFSETLAEELRPHNVTVNCIAPGTMTTDMHREIFVAGSEAAGEKEYGQSKALLSNGETAPSQALDLITFLASTESDSITGKLISAVWDPWRSIATHLGDLDSDIYTLRRITPEDRGLSWEKSQA